MAEDSSQLLGLPAPGETHYESETIEPHQTLERDRRSIVYGRDLNSSDLLLLGANRSLKAIMHDAYGINPDFSWEFPSVFTTTSRKVIVDDGTNRYFIKEKPAYTCTPYKLALSAQFQEFLSDHTSFVPKITKTKSGYSYLQIGRSYFLVTEFKEGRIFNGTLEDVASAGETLGTIHFLSQDFDFQGLQKKSAVGDTLEFIEMADHLQGAQNDEWREEAINALREIVGQYGEQVDRGVPYIVNHADYAPFNLVYGKNGVVAVNDFDNVDYRPRIRDLAGALISFCDGISYAGATSSLRKPIATRFDLKKAQAFIKGYLSNAPSLSDNEKSQLVGEMSIRWAKIMALGIVRGDFNYFEVLQALPFQTFIENYLPTIL